LYKKRQIFPDNPKWEFPAFLATFTYRAVGNQNKLAFHQIDAVSKLCYNIFVMDNASATDGLKWSTTRSTGVFCRPSGHTFTLAGGVCLFCLIGGN
jgi:hypothetical protein